jgi:hypothetical protein
LLDAVEGKIRFTYDNASAVKPGRIAEMYRAAIAGIPRVTTA